MRGSTYQPQVAAGAKEFRLQRNPQKRLIYWSIEAKKTIVKIYLGTLLIIGQKTYHTILEEIHISVFFSSTQI